MIIDFHTHTFPSKIAPKVVDQLGHVAHIQYFTDGSLEGLIDSMKNAGIDYSLNLPVATSIKQCEGVNFGLAEEMEELLAKGIVTFAGMRSDYEDYKPLMKKFKELGFKGIKIHPPYQGCNLKDISFKRILGYASELGLITITHAGIDVGIYDQNYADIDTILDILEDVKPENFVLAHMGNWGLWDDVEKYLCGAPVWFDTAFSMGPVTQLKGDPEKPIMSHLMDDDQFVRIVRKHGADKVLFATDSPWADQTTYVNMVKNSGLNEEEINMVMGDNARGLLRL